MSQNVYCMTLKEMIEFLGDDFRDLVYHSYQTSDPRSRRWTVKVGKRRLGHWMVVTGHTPEEALEKAITKLHAKEESN